MSKTLVLIKPDAVERGLVGTIINRIETAGFTIHALKVMHDNRWIIQQHYIEHANKVYYSDLVASMAGPLVAMVVEYKKAPAITVPTMRQLIGPYEDRIVGTIRGDFALDNRRNSIHASDYMDSARREIKLWFPEGY